MQRQSLHQRSALTCTVYACVPDEPELYSQSVTQLLRVWTLPEPRCTHSRLARSKQRQGPKRTSCCISSCASQRERIECRPARTHRMPPKTTSWLQTSPRQARAGKQSHPVREPLPPSSQCNSCPRPCKRTKRSASVCGADHAQAQAVREGSEIVHDARQGRAARVYDPRA